MQQVSLRYDADIFFASAEATFAVDAATRRAISRQLRCACRLYNTPPRCCSPCRRYAILIFATKYAAYFRRAIDTTARSRACHYAVYMLALRLLLMVLMRAGLYAAMLSRHD